MHCPFCQTELPEDAQHCTRCDWVKHPDLPPLHPADWVASGLSVIPGLGHFYKGHLLPGLLVFFVLSPAVAIITLFLLPATLGTILILPAAFFGIVAAHAFHLRDARANPGMGRQASLTLREWLDIFRPAT